MKVDVTTFLDNTNILLIQLQYLCVIWAEFSYDVFIVSQSLS